jgi:ADP-heptose:LPS heptosyltransferase
MYDMALAEIAQKASPLLRRMIDATELEYIAFSGQYEMAHGIFRSIPEEERHLYVNKYILSEVITGGINKLKKFLAASAEAPAADEKAFIDDTVKLFVSSCRGSNTYPRELFQSLLDWSEELTRLSLLLESLYYYNEAFALGVNRYPDLCVRAWLGKARILNTVGRFHDAQEMLRSLAARPYVITDRNSIPDVLFNLGKESLLKGDIAYYKRLLFSGLRHFYTRVENRKLFVEQIVKTYRRSWNVIVDRRISFSDKALFFLHRLHFAVKGVRSLRVLRIADATRILVLGYVYCLNYGFQRPMLDSATYGDAGQPLLPRGSSKRKNVLVTRAMGGIGDLLMMTPGFHELKRRRPHDEIHLAIPKRYFPVFEGNRDVTLLDIEHDEFDSTRYKRWFNFTDCPASRVESRSAPKVKKGRIEIFARALGINAFAVRRMVKRPRYFALPEEQAFQLNFWRAHGLEGKRVIGIQFRSDEVYRDYPHMRQLAARVANDYSVLLFDVEKIHGLDEAGILKVDTLPMRHAFALATACDAIIAPDSSFVHLAAAFDIPCVALYGPVDGEVRTRDYPKCSYLDVKTKLGCMPCWRNEQIPCKLTNMRASVCMADISIEEVCNALTDILQGENQE